MSYMDELNAAKGKTVTPGSSVHTHTHQHNYYLCDLTCFYKISRASKKHTLQQGEANESYDSGDLSYVLPLVIGGALVGLSMTIIQLILVVLERVQCLLVLLPCQPLVAPPTERVTRTSPHYQQLHPFHCPLLSPPPPPPPAPHLRPHHH